MANQEDVDRAVESSKEAFKRDDWAKMRPTDRAALLFRIADHLEKHKEELAVLESIENGKPINVSLTESAGLIQDVFRFMGGQADKIEGSTLIDDHSNVFRYTKKSPIGVCGGITPWNFPNAMVAWKIAPLIAAGCTGVIKPAEMTSLGALRMAELCCEAGLPKGVFNVIPGLGEEIGPYLIKH